MHPDDPRWPHYFGTLKRHSAQVVRWELPLGELLVVLSALQLGDVLQCLTPRMRATLDTVLPALIRQLEALDPVLGVVARLGVVPPDAGPRAAAP